MSSNKKYWKHVEELSPGQEAAVTSLKHKEFVQEIPVDEFLGDNLGLVVAEIELEKEEENFKKPNWLGEEVTGIAKYYNSNISKLPYSTW